MHLAPNTPIVILTGAGISAESGISTFRDGNGLWEQHRIEDVATPEAFLRNPEFVHRFYSQRRAQLFEVQPNAAHHALAELEQHWPGGVLLVTQNVDDLHERAGSRNLIHMHGELRKLRCLRCGSIHNREGPVELGTPCPTCSRVACLRPHIVWFGEMPFEMDRIEAALTTCGAFLSIGTSGKVYPAAGFVEWVGAAALTVEMNLAPSDNSALFQVHRSGPAGRTVPAWVAELLSGLKG